MTKLGNDPFGKRIIRAFDDNGIASEFVSLSEERKTGFMMKGRTGGERDPDIFYFRSGSAASTISVDDVSKINYSDYTNIHLTGILPALSPSCLEAVEYMIEQARSAGLLISFDPNLRPQLWPSNEVMIRTINDLASKCDIVLPGALEGKVLTGIDDPQKINAFYLKNGAKISITKCGAKGAYVSTENERYTVPAFKVKVVDTVGAGDGFAAGVITALMEGKTLREAVVRGNAIGAIQVTFRGDNEGLPYPDGLKAFIQAQGAIA